MPNIIKDALHNPIEEKLYRNNWGSSLVYVYRSGENFVADHEDGRKSVPVVNSGYGSRETILAHDLVPMTGEDILRVLRQSQSRLNLVEMAIRLQEEAEAAAKTKMLLHYK